MKRLLCLLLALWLCVACAAASAEEMSLLAINVGKADCLLLQSGDSRYLIDTGLKESWGAVSSALRVRGIDRLDGVILTHTDKDHAGGAWALATSGIAVGGWYAPAYYTDGKEGKHPLALAAALRGEEVVWLRAGDTLPLEGGTLTVLGPLALDEDKENNNSLVLRAETAAGSMLLTGDMEFPEERTLIQAGLIGHADVLKVAHHGEDDATSASLARLVSPLAAVISTSTQARPETPSPDVVRLLRNQGAQVAVTQDAQEGVLVTLRDGQPTVSLLPEAAKPAPVEGVVISDRSVAQDTVCVHNGGDTAADLSGWYLYSSRGGETFVLPEGTRLAPGESLCVSALDSPDRGDLLWPDEKVWHAKKDDAACLYDAYGRLMDTLE